MLILERAAKGQRLADSLDGLPGITGIGCGKDEFIVYHKAKLPAKVAKAIPGTWEKIPVRTSKIGKLHPAFR